jgi:hypothetical protein
MTVYDVWAFEGLMALMLVFAILFILGLGAAVAEGIPWARIGVNVRCRLRYWALRYREWRTRKPLMSGESLWSRLKALQHEHDPEHVIGGKPRW